MKWIRSALILAVMLTCTGCGQKIEQEELLSVPEVTAETESETVESTEKSTTTYPKKFVPTPETTAESEETTELLAEPETTVAVTTQATTAVQTTVQTVVITEPVIMTAPPPPETEPETEPEPEHPKYSGNAQEILEQMTLEEKVYQMFIVTPEMLTGAEVVTACGERTRESLSQYPVGGLIYFDQNLSYPKQTTDMLNNTQNYMRKHIGIGMFLGIDEEGGKVARCAKNLETTAFSPMADYGERNDWNEAYRIGQTIGKEISQLGFNVDFAPVADVNLNSNNELGNRIFSSNPEVVSNMVSGVVKGFRNAGTASTLKHFPGLGAENGNTHNDSEVVIDRSLDDLRNTEFLPFRSGIEAGAEFVMVGHQIVTGAEDNLPSSLSQVVCTDWLRGELGFDGIIITDSFRMNTISKNYSAGESAVTAVNAGVDMILMPSDLTVSVEAIENAVHNGQISEERINQSVYRILSEKEKLNLLG